jgi:transposase
VCFEAGPTGYGLYRQVRDLGHDCTVGAPALIPKRSGVRIPVMVIGHSGRW